MAEGEVECLLTNLSVSEDVPKGGNLTSVLRCVGSLVSECRQSVRQVSNIRSAFGGSKQP
jgi:hypothetical protein